MRVGWLTQHPLAPNLFKSNWFSLQLLTFQPIIITVLLLEIAKRALLCSFNVLNSLNSPLESKKCCEATKLFGFCSYFLNAMPPVPVVNSDVGEKLANESTSSESLDQSNSLDKTNEPFLDEEKGEQKVALKKNVSIINGVGLIVGTVIGSGIFLSPTSILEETNSIGASLLVWLGCGLLALFGSLCYAELGTMITKSGGEYSYLMVAFGRIPAYLFAWTSVLIIRPASGAIIALTFAEYVAKPFYPDSQPPTYLMKLLACSCLGKMSALLNSRIV